MYEWISIMFLEWINKKKKYLIFYKLDIVIKMIILLLYMNAILLIN